MDDPKKYLRHELLNLFTIINHFLYQEKWNDSIKNEIADRLKTASLLVGHEDLFLGKQPHFFFQEVSLNEVLDSIKSILAHELERNGSTLKQPPEQVVLVLDRYYLTEALQQIFKRLIQSENHLEVHFDESKSHLIIHHQGPAILPQQPLPLLDHLRKKKSSHEDIAYHLGLEILKGYGSSISEEEGLLTIPLPAQQDSRI